MKIRIALIIVCFFLAQPLFSQNKKSALTKEEMANYESEIKGMVKYLEETVNYIGDSTVSAQEKEIIFNESYSKIFKDDKVQIEDDLDEQRLTPINKDVQAYLKDIDFFFDYAQFKFDVQNIASFVNENDQNFFKVTMTRKLVGKTVTTDSVNNNKTRYIEINLDRQKNDLRIVSIYTTKLNEREELKHWWNNMPQVWKSYFANGQTVYDSIPLDSVYRIKEDGFFGAYRKINGNDTVWANDLIKSDMEEIFAKLKSITQMQHVDVSNLENINELDPLSELSNLTTLNITKTNVSDLTPLRNANKMTKLVANNTMIDDLSSLKYDLALKELEVANTQVSDLSVLESLPNLQLLNISETPVEDLSWISYTQNLTELKADGSRITSLDALTKTPNLLYLDISNTKVVDLSPLQTLTGLQTLDISKTDIVNLSPLKDLQDLKEIRCSFTPLSDLSPLAQHRRLSKIYCDNTEIKTLEASEFTKENPYTLVIYDTQALKTWWDDLPIYWKAVFSKQTKIETEPTTEELHKVINMTELDLSGNMYLQNLNPVSRLTNLETLNISNTEIIRLDPLYGMPNLSSINLENTYVANLKGLSNVFSLNTIIMNNTPVDDLESITKLSNLKLVEADGTNINAEQVFNLKMNQPQATVIFQTKQLQEWWGNMESNWKEVLQEHVPFNTTNPSALELQKMVDLKEVVVNPAIVIETLEPISKFVWIEKLSAQNQSIRDLSPLSNKQFLKELEIQSNPITDLKPIEMDVTLESIDIENTQVSDLGPLEKMSNLKILNASGTAIKSLKPLSNLEQLEKLMVYNTNVKSLSPIENIPSLKLLKIYNTKIKSKTVDDLQQKRFDMNIMYY